VFHIYFTYIDDARSNKYEVKNLEALIVTSKVFGLEVSAEKMKYVVVSQNQHAVQHHNINVGNKAFEWWNSSNILEQP
jgi:hypothetical protein